LALQVAADVVEGYPDGAWLAEFAPLADPALVPKTVASAMSVAEQPGREMTETLVDALRPKALLLVLDNCEHLLAACADLAAALLRACPQVRILATSREGLGVPGETLWRVPSLSLPDVRRLPPSEDLMLYEAVRLFVDRALLTTASVDSCAPA
jgi:predicted ATPase